MYHVNSKATKNLFISNVDTHSLKRERGKAENNDGGARIVIRCDDSNVILQQLDFESGIFDLKLYNHTTLQTVLQSSHTP